MQHTTTCRIAILVALAGGLTSAHPAAAAVESWNAPGGGAFEEPTNWQGTMVPDAADEAIFDLNAAYTVVLSQDVAIDRFSLGRDIVTFVAGANTLTLGRTIGLTDPSLAVGLASGDEPSLLLNSGTFAGEDASLGFGAGSQAMVAVNGLDSSLALNGTLAVGDQGFASLSILDGASVINGRSRIGLGATGDGAVSVSGMDATWTSLFSLRVGVDGVGDVTIADGGFAEASAIEIGFNSGGVGDVTTTGAGTTLRAAGAMTVGLNGDGSLLVSDGGEALAASASIGGNGGSLGDATVTGLGSMWTITNTLEIGENGIGALMIEQDGSVSADSVEIANGAGSGQVTVRSGGTLASSFQITAGLSGGFGSITLDGGTVVGSGLVVGPGAQLIGEGQVTADVFNGGLIRVGNPTGLLTILGDFDQSAALGGALLVEIDTNADVLAVNGIAMLGGRLTISLRPGFTPISGDEFTLVVAGTRVGEFETVQAPPDSGGLTYAVEYRGNSVVLVVGSALVGDLNGDGAVDGADLGLLLFSWDDPGGPADLNGDGTVDGADLGLLLGNWTG